MEDTTCPAQSDGLRGVRPLSFTIMSRCLAMMSSRETLESDIELHRI